MSVPGWGGVGLVGSKSREKFQGSGEGEGEGNWGRGTRSVLWAEASEFEGGKFQGREDRSG